MAFRITNPGEPLPIQEEEREPQGFGHRMLKNLAIGGSSIATGAAGLVPMATSALATGGKWLSEKLNPEDAGTREMLDKVKGYAEKATPSKLQGYLGDLTGGYLTPKTKIQKAVGEFATDVGSSIVLGPVALGTKIAAFGNAAKQAVKYLGASDEKAEYAKIIGMMTSPLFKFNNIRSIYKTLYSDARKALAKRGARAITETKSLRDSARKVLKTASRGSGEGVEATPSRKISKGILKKLEAQVDKKDLDKLSKKILESRLKNSTKEISKEGLKGLKKHVKEKAFNALKKQHPAHISIDDVWELNKQMNQAIFKMGKYIDVKNYMFKPLRNAVNNTLEAYSKKNKEFGYAFKNAQTLFGIERGLPILDKAINKVVGLKDTGVSEYFRKSMAWGFGGLKGLLAKNVIGSLTKRADAFIHSPAYRKASIQLAKATITKNSLPMAVSAVKKLKKIYDKENDGKFTITKV